MFDSMAQEGFQLSPQQERLWALGGRADGSPFTARCVVRILGVVDEAALDAALTELGARHEILRTTFHAAEDMTLPLQVIAEQGVEIERRDLTAPGAPSAAGAEAASRARILQLTTGPEERLLVVRLPSLCCDRKGLENLMADLCRSYGARRAGAATGDDPLQYADAAAWLNDAMVADETAAGRQYWQALRQGEAGAAVLPFERDQAAGTFQPDRIEMEPLPQTVARAPDGLVLACWIHLLQRLTDNAEATTAIEYDGRQYAELRDAVGLYARTLPLPSRLDPSMDAVAVAGQVALDVKEAQRWGDVFDVRQLPGRGDSPAPFVFERRDPSPPLHAAGVTFEVVECNAVIDRYRLKLVYEAGDTSKLRLEFDASRYSREDARAVASRLGVLLAHAAASPAAPLPAHPLTSDEDARALTQAPARAPGELPCVHQQFEEWAARTPDRPAVTVEGGRLTFAELNTRANQLAHRLRQRGVAADTPVGLCVDRSVDLFVGLLGVLKAGGGYVALDPRLPANRLGGMIESAGASLVVTTRQHRDLVGGGRAVLLDDDADPLAAAPSGNLDTPVRPRHLAYVLFTSGSTGRPKGVAIEHRQLAAYIDAIRGRLGLAGLPPGTAYASVTTIAADLGNTTIYPSLTGGGHLHLIAEDRASNAESFAEYMDAHQIDVLKIVPAHLRALLSCSRPARALPRLRLVFGGEACPWDLVDQVQSLAPGCRVFNHYGPTETTVGATAYEVVRGAARGGTIVPIGRPLDHASAYVLDPYGRPVPPWCVGELYVGGYGVARGYVNAAPAEPGPFLPDPFSPDASARMYKTGDRVRLLPSGDLEFLGRADDQVKIRGFRIELGEIEATLRAHASVQDASVLAAESEGGDKRIVAFVAGVLERPDVTALRAHLAERLPDYMLPASITVVESIDRNANGKIDRQALLARAATPAAAAAAPDQEAATDWERAVADLWRELLEVDEITAQDNFYDLGGHSLMAIQVVTAIEKRHGVRVAARDLVFHTLRQFAALCESRAAGSAAAPRETRG